MVLREAEGRPLSVDGLQALITAHYGLSQTRARTEARKLVRDYLECGVLVSDRGR